MFDATFAALAQMTSPPFRRVLLKSAGLALAMIALVGIGLQRAFAWFAQAGATWAESSVGAVPHAAWEILVWIVSIAATLGIVTGAVFLMPAVTAFVGSFFVDEIATEVERRHYPADAPGRELPLGRAILEGGQTAILAVAVYLCALPLLFFAGFGLAVLFIASAYLLSREYFLLAAMRFRPPDDAKAMRRAFRLRIFLAGLPVAVFVSIPIVNLATPLFAMALMVHLHKRLSRMSADVLAPGRV